MDAADIEADILEAIAEEARRAVDEGVASEADVDLALRLGGCGPAAGVLWRGVVDAVRGAAARPPQ